MRTVAAFDAKNTFGSLLDMVERGEEITITRHGKPVARLVAPVDKVDRSDALKALEEIRKMSKGVTLGGLSIRDMIDEGRR
jgi:prevent-host-death family protein